MQSYKEQKRNKLLARMENDWVIDTVNYEIKLKKQSWYIVFWYWITLKRYTVKDLYIYVYEHFHAPERIAELMPIAFPIDHDNIKKPKGVPYNYVLQGAWSIPEEYSKKLIKGPLISEDGATLIVKTDSYVHIISRLVGRIIMWLTIPGGLYGSWQFITSVS